MQLRAAPPYSLHRAVERSLSPRLPAPQTGSAQAARQTAPARARSLPRRPRTFLIHEVGVSGLEPAAKQPASGPPGTHPPIPRPPSLLMFFACQPPCPADAAPCGSAVLAPSAVEPSPPASLPPRRSAPRKLLAELLPPALDHLLVADGTLHPARPGCPPWSLRPKQPASGPPGTPTPSPTPARPLEVLRLPAAVTRRCSSVRKRTRTIVGEAPVPCQPHHPHPRHPPPASFEPLWPRRFSSCTRRSPRSTGGVSPASSSMPPSCRGGASPQFPPVRPI